MALATEMGMKHWFSRIRCIFVVFLFSATIFASEEKNVYQYPIAADSNERLLYAAQLMGALQNIYYSDLFIKGASLRWNFDWNQDYLGAGSSFNLGKSEFGILLNGGQIRLKNSNFEVLAVTLCHEFGHYLGGKPKQMFFPGVEDWSSAEGQSDWFATSDCLPKVFKKFYWENPKLLQFHNFEKTNALCLLAKEKTQCQWILGAVENWAQVLSQVYEPDLAKPTLEVFATEIAQETLHTKYPTMQCRLDTMREGNFCNDRECERPACWFKKEVDLKSLGCLMNCPSN